MKYCTLAPLLIALMSAPSLSHSQQAVTYTVGASTCGPASGTWIDCYSMPITLGTTTTTMWIEADYPPYAAEDFLVGVLGDYETSSVQIKTVTNICWTSLGKTYCENLPTEVTANLTGFEGTTGTGTLNLKLSYAIGATGRYTRGPIASTAGGSVTIMH